MHALEPESLRDAIRTPDEHIQTRAYRAEAEAARLRDRLFAVYQLANQHGSHPQIIEAIEAELFRSKQ